QGGQLVDARADVYSLGVVLYELLVGRLPFAGDTAYVIIHKHIYEAPPLPSHLNPAITPQIDAVLMRALAKSPDDRYLSANALAQALKAAVTDSDFQQDYANAAPVVTGGGGTPAGGRMVNIPAPNNIPSPNIPSAAPSALMIDLPQHISLFSAQTLPEIVTRFRETVEDIRHQLTDGESFQLARSRAEQAYVEIKSHVQQHGSEISIDLSGGTVKINTGSAKLIDTGSRRQSRLIKRDWSGDQPSMRWRVRQRVQLRRGLIGHAAVYIMVGALLVTLNPILSVVMTDAIAESGESWLAALATLNIPAVVLLLWGGGLVSHALAVFNHTGRMNERRREALHDTMQRRYGEEWMSVANDKEYKGVQRQINKRFDAPLGFFQHFVTGLTAVIALNIAWVPLQTMMLALIAAQDDTDLDFMRQLFLEQRTPLFFALLVSITVVIHGLRVFLAPMVGQEAEDREYERELERSTAASAKAKNRMSAPSVRLTQDGEFTESFAQSIDEQAEAGNQR
ncbi:MAG: 2TM domain-containing protein, partial [Armatimonadetes bacterium]|nr:2TM domain-containing protein [Anaerolineae bacterium]